MTDNKKKNIKAGLSTVLVHALIVGLLALLSLSKAQPNKEKEDGVPVLLGMVEDAGGEDIGGLPAEEASPEGEENLTDETAVEEVPLAPPPTPKPVSAPKPTPAPKPQSAAKPLITQEQEKSIAAEEAKKKAAEAAAKRKTAEEAAKKRAAEEAARKKAAEEAARKKAEEEARKKAEADRKAAAAANNRVAGAFGNAGNKGSSGNTTGNGAQGSPTGNSNMGATTGVGGGGVTYKVGTRIVRYLADPDKTAVTSETEGTIVVSITVTPEGNVINPKIVNSTTASVALKNAAIEAAKKTKFTPGTTTDIGTTTYKFKAK